MMFAIWVAFSNQGSLKFNFFSTTKTNKQGLVKGAKLCLNPYFFGWLEK